MTFTAPTGSAVTASSTTVSQQVQQRIDAGQLVADPAQAATIAALDGLLAQLHAPPLANKKSALGWLFGRKKAPAPGLRGLYLWGGVGRGKSMLMDMFFALAPTEPRRRVHFHAFMQDVHGRIHTWRQAQKTAKDRSADPIPPLADALAHEAQLLCFDEFAVTDVADAMILARLFTGLFERGVTVVATSNVAPDLLYKDGLNRSFFLPFIELVKTRMDVIELVSETDHRMSILAGSPVYMVGADRHSRFDDLWHQMVGTSPVEPAVVERAGRKLAFEQTCGGLLRTDFARLCQRPLGAGDYLAITARFHTLFLEVVPVMEHGDRNAVKRFIALVDTLYEAGNRLIVEAEAPPDGLYPVEHGTEAFEFQRTISRLSEMQGVDWANQYA